MFDDLTVSDAIEWLDGHTVLSEMSARLACAVLGVSFPEHRLMTWQTVEEAYAKYGFFAEEAPSAGMDGLDLSYHVAQELGIEAPGRRYSGRGFQSQSNQQAIRQHLSAVGKL